MVTKTSGLEDSEGLHLDPHGPCTIVEDNVFSQYLWNYVVYR